MSILRLGSLLRDRRGSRGIREVAAEIGISPATLTRVEGGRIPDLGTFSKVCIWLKVDPADFLDIPVAARQGNDLPIEGEISAAAVHLRAEQALPAAAATDLAQLIVAAHRELARRTRGRQTDVSSWL